VKSHFENIKQKGKYVYIVRQKETNEVLYIGKAGTINQNGEFKNQDLIGRLTNVRGEKISANEWFKNLYKEKGPLIVEYILLPETESPGYVENLLLQLYLNEHGRLPCKNEKL